MTGVKVVAVCVVIVLALVGAAHAAESGDEDEGSSQDYRLPEEVVSTPRPVSCASYQEILDKDFEIFPRQNLDRLVRPSR